MFFILYPFKYSQKLIDRLPFKFVVRTFADTFYGGFRDGTFKDGRRGDRDCRRFAGYYFLFRVVVFIIFVSNLTWLMQYFIQQVLCTVCFFVFATVRPYKKEFYNNLDTSMFTLLAILNAFSLYNSQKYYYIHRIDEVVFWINYLLIFLPLIYIICYVVYLILLWKGCLKTTKFELVRPENFPAPVGDSNLFDEGRVLLGDDHDPRNSQVNVPDRLVNPQNYNSRNLYKPHGVSPSEQNARLAKLQRSSENSYFHGKRDKVPVPYGSLNESSLTHLECHSEPPMRRGGRSDVDTAVAGGKRSGAGNNGKDSDGKPVNVAFKGVV